MSTPTIVEFSRSAEVVFDATCSAAARLGFSILDMNQRARLLTFIAGGNSSRCSAFVESVSNDRARLTISGNVPASNLVVPALINRGALVGAALTQIGSVSRVANRLVQAVEVDLGSSTAVRRSSGYGCFIALAIAVGIGLLLILANIGNGNSNDGQADNSGNVDSSTASNNQSDDASKGSAITPPEDTGSTASPETAPPSDTTPSAQMAPSFNCTNVHNPVLKLICGTPGLSELDNQLATTYATALAASSSRKSLIRSERAWISQRNSSVAGVDSLTQMYNERIAFLKDPSSQPSSPNAQAGSSATPVSSADGIMQPRFGNTIISRSANAEWHLYFQSDGTFSGDETYSGYHAAGTWTLNGNDLCLTYQPPISGAANPECQPVESHIIGETWTSGEDTVTLVQGIQ